MVQVVAAASATASDCPSSLTATEISLGFIEIISLPMCALTLSTIDSDTSF